MDGRASCEVQDAPRSEKAVAPDAMGDGKIHEKQPKGQEDHISRKLDPVGEGPRDQGRSDDGEHHLIDEEDEDRDAVGGGEQIARMHALQERVTEIADHASRSA